MLFLHGLRILSTDFRFAAFCTEMRSEFPVITKNSIQKEREKVKYDKT